MTNEQRDMIWGFVTGASICMSWGNRPYALHALLEESIYRTCGQHARHGLAGCAWADEASVNVSLAAAFLAAAEYAGVALTVADVDAACLFMERLHFQWDGLLDPPQTWEALKAATESQGRIWDPISPDRPLRAVSWWAGEVTNYL